MLPLRMIVLAGALAGALSACGTPPEVKTLSAAQVTYLQQTSTAVSAQSKALLTLAQAHATVLKAEWKKTEEARLAQFTQAAKSDPSSTGELIQAAAQYGAGWQTRGARLDQVASIAGTLDGQLKDIAAMGDAQ